MRGDLSDMSAADAALRKGQGPTACPGGMVSVDAGMAGRTGQDEILGIGEEEETEE
jgi:hypothetical protein